MEKDKDIEIYDKIDINRCVKNIGIGLNKLRPFGKGNVLEVELSRCNTAFDFMVFISHICLYYFLQFRQYLMSDVEYKELMDTALESRTRKEVINLILMHSYMKH